MRTARPLATLAIAAAALTLAACGGTQPGRDAGNVRVCEHYRTQRATVKNLAEPAVADAIRFAAWVALDARQATPGTPLKRDLAAMSAAQQAASSPPAALYDASARVLRDCAALGVKF